MSNYVYAFNQGTKEMRDLLGGKGANLAEMTRLGMPVPPGFTITTQACRVYLSSGQEPAELAARGAEGPSNRERPTGTTSGGTRILAA